MLGISKLTGSLFAPPDQKTGVLAARYDAAAPDWQRKICGLGYPEAYAELVGSPPQLEPVVVLDAGAGTGALSQALLAANWPVRRLDLLDPSSSMLAEARRQLDPPGCDLRLIQSAIGDAEPALAAYDVVLCGHAIEHVADPAAAIRWLAARLKPGGRMFLSVSKPHWCTALLSAKWRNGAYRPSEITGWLAAAGLSTAEIVRFRRGPPSRTSCGYRATR